MKKLIIAFGMALAALTAFSSHTQNRQDWKVFVDNDGVMRRSDTKAEVSYYGTNYTLPFAHAFRAEGYLGKDRKKAIERDVYHMKRLGFNAFRLHLWDVELADSTGNLLQNEHLDLLDYLIKTLEDAGIDIVLTAQTNFGNGYPEKNADTGSFSYDFPKCGIHENPQAQAIQANYLTQLASHKNPYTGRSYSADNAIIGIEINNEPCHAGTSAEVTHYINRMVAALKKGGFRKPVFYNVSHNPDVTEGYYKAGIQGTTYQWYPTGLVAGHERKGNFLPAVDEYNIPWKESIPGYKKTARLVYEFDPGDVLAAYLYPAIARTFRKEGFQWITQFAYDPTDLAPYNTEYQTHFLNLAYTPSKALSMMIAGEAAREIPRNSDFGTFPQDTVFGNFRVSHTLNLSELNDGTKFFHSNPTNTEPKNPENLRNVAGVGSSPVVAYQGTGAYFLDATERPGVWRLEAMPDAMVIADPFEKPSLLKPVAAVAYREHPMTINLPGLANGFSYQAINEGNNRTGTAHGNTMHVFPGTYLLSSDAGNLGNALADMEFMGHDMRSFEAPEETRVPNVVAREPHVAINPDNSATITATVFGNTIPDKVTVYPSTVSFWKEENPIAEMTLSSPYTYTATIPLEGYAYGGKLKFNIVVEENGKSKTWPGNISGTPLGWDYSPAGFYEKKIPDSSFPTVLLSPRENDPDLEAVMIPEDWTFRVIPELHAPYGADAYRIVANPDKEGKIVMRRYVAPEISKSDTSRKDIVVKVEDTSGFEGMEVALVGANGATYSAPVTYTKKPGVQTVKIPISSLTQTNTLIVPAPYPTFLGREAKVGKLPLEMENTDFIEVRIPLHPGVAVDGTILGIWLE